MTSLDGCRLASVPLLLLRGVSGFPFYVEQRHPPNAVTLDFEMFERNTVVIIGLYLVDVRRCRRTG